MASTAKNEKTCLLKRLFFSLLRESVLVKILALVKKNYLSKIMAKKSKICSRAVFRKSSNFQTSEELFPKSIFDYFLLFLFTNEEILKFILHKTNY